jgi:methionyl aminopeptidase
LASRSIQIKSATDLVRMRDAGRIVYLVLEDLRLAAVPGRTTDELDRLAHRRAVQLGASPAFLNYHGYPKSLCASLNDEVVHGIPRGDRVLKDGDLLKLDFGAAFQGYYCDAAITVEIGEVSAEARKLARVTREALERGIAAARVGNRVSDIGAAIQAHAEANGFQVVRNYVGHGIGRALHEAPKIPNYRSAEGAGTSGDDAKLEEGMVLAIEPMVNAGDFPTRVLQDRWTAVTADGCLSAHFEHTVAVTQAGPEVLTLA